MDEHERTSGNESGDDLERLLAEARGKVQELRLRNERLDLTLREARDHLEALKQEVTRLSQTPLTYGVVTAIYGNGTVDVASSGRKFNLELGTLVDAERGDDFDEIRIGDQVVLNDSLSVVERRSADLTGDLVTLDRVLDDGIRAVVRTRGDEERVCDLADNLRGTILRNGDLLRLDSRANLLLERIAQPDAEHLVLEVVPDVTYGDIGGLDDQIEQIADAVELPYLHKDLFAEYQLSAPKGILLYGPPGCGKTLIAKAVANSLAKKVAAQNGDEKSKSYFINVKGPELLNKYVGETERQIRLVFQRAREKSEEGWPVIVFFDEMDSMFRTRGTGISSDMESTIVPQLLAEIDGVERLQNVIVIGATNREDLIDPAILRPGRLDVKIRIDRPDREAAAQIFDRYISEDLPFDAELVEQCAGQQGAKELLVRSAVEAMYAEHEGNEFLEVTYQHGEKETLHFKDFASGAMIENIVRRAKKSAIKRRLAGGTSGLCARDLESAVRQEFLEHEDLPNTTNPDDWAKISGRKGERIVFIRTLGDASRVGGKALDHPVTGQYL
jgi:proteasome-associated ATPase